MKGLVYHGPGQRAWETVPDRRIEQPTDAIVRIDTSTICGTDLHILKGDVPEVKPGTILGHEAVGTVVEVGSGGHDVAAGRPRAGLLHHLVRALPLLQARATTGLCIGRRRLDLRPPDRRPAGRVRAGPVRRYLRLQGARRLSDEQVLFLADILPTAYEVGVLNGGVEPGDTVAIVGAGPIGLATIMTAQLLHAGADHRYRPRRRAPGAGAASSVPTSRSTTAARTRSRA